MWSSPPGGYVNYVIVDGVIVVGVGKGKCGLSRNCWSRGNTVVGGDIDTRDMMPWRWCEGRNGGGG